VHFEPLSGVLVGGLSSPTVYQKWGFSGAFFFFFFFDQGKFIFHTSFAKGSGKHNETY